MAHWDIFHGETLELERGLSTQDVRAALASGGLRDDDLARPAGTNTAWLPISQVDELMALEPTPTLAHAPPPPSAPPEPKSQPPAPRPESIASTVPLPDWFELGTEPDDVSFPVIPGFPKPPSKETKRPENRSQDVIPEKSRLAPKEPSPSPPVPPTPAWIWEDDEEDDSEEVEAVTFPVSGEPARVSAESAPVSPEEGHAGLEFADSDLELDILDDEPAGSARFPVVAERSSTVALPVVASRDWDPSPLADVEDEDEEVEETFTFARRATNKVEELDLAPMVDVAFQLVLFFMVTATTVLYKSLEVPKPSAENPPEAVAQGRSKTLDDMRDDFIVVEIDPSGAFKIDREPVVADMTTLVDRLRSARDKTARLTMLLSADYATPHRFAVLAIDAANEIGLRIAVARPQGKQAAAPAPTIFPINPPAGQPKREGTAKGF